MKVFSDLNLRRVRDIQIAHLCIAVHDELRLNISLCPGCNGLNSGSVEKDA